MSLYNFIKYNNCISWLPYPSTHDKITHLDSTVNGTITEYLLTNGTKAAYFNGASYLSGFNYTIPTTFTVATWVYISSAPSVQYTILDTGNADNSDKIMLYITSASVVTAKIASNTSYSKSATYTIETGQWYHVTMTRDGSNIKLYINGMLVTTTAETYGIDSQTVVSVGKLITGASPYYLTGYMKNLMIFSGLLSTKQIQKLYYYTYIS